MLVFNLKFNILKQTDKIGTKRKEKKYLISLKKISDNNNTCLHNTNGYWEHNLKQPQLGIARFFDHRENTC